MAYKLNLVTMDIRKRMVEYVKKYKIHDKEKTYLSTQDYKEEKQEMSKEKSKRRKKRYLTIDAVKNENKRVNINAERDKDKLDEESLGIFIDKKK